MTSLASIFPYKFEVVQSVSLGSFKKVKPLAEAFEKYDCRKYLREDLCERAFHKNGFTVYTHMTKTNEVFFSCGYIKTDKILVHEAITNDKKYLISLECVLTKSGLDGMESVKLIAARIDTLRIVEPQPQKLIQIM